MEISLYTLLRPTEHNRLAAQIIVCTAQCITPKPLKFSGSHLGCVYAVITTEAPSIQLAASTPTVWCVSTQRRGLRVEGCWEGHNYSRSTRVTCPASKRVVQ